MWWAAYNSSGEPEAGPVVVAAPAHIVAVAVAAHIAAEVVAAVAA